jgi:hypothetical protein
MRLSVTLYNQNLPNSVRKYLMATSLLQISDKNFHCANLFPMLNAHNDYGIISRETHKQHWSQGTCRRRETVTIKHHVHNSLIMQFRITHRTLVLWYCLYAHASPRWWWCLCSLECAYIFPKKAASVSLRAQAFFVVAQRAKESIISSAEETSWAVLFLLGAHHAHTNTTTHATLQPTTSSGRR